VRITHLSRGDAHEQGAGATITEVEGAYVVMISRPDVITGVIKTAAAAVWRPVATTAG
jgi:hypothetical protein